MKKRLWKRLNDLRVCMVMHRVDARIINKVSKICIRMGKNDEA